MIVSQSLSSRRMRANRTRPLAGHCTGRRKNGWYRSRVLATTRSRAFTLIELLVVITIVLLISAVALPTVLPALNHRQVSEAARILQAALAGARDAAIRNNAPSGIRLLPDPTYLVRNSASGLIDPTQPLASNRIVPIEPAPEYTEGLVNVYTKQSYINFASTNPQWPPVYLVQPSYYYPVLVAVTSGGASPTTTYVNANSSKNPSYLNANVLMIEESIQATSGAPNAPTSWYWNIRVGDRIQINNSGAWYTVVGPIVVNGSGNSSSGNGNPEQFVNVGPPGQASPLLRYNTNNNPIHPEFLFVVNGQDDNNNGWVDEGWDGVDNNGDGTIDDLGEWESETWPAALTANDGVTNATYTIQRRPAPASNAREVSLPSDVVVDLTTSFYAAGTTSTTPNLSNPSRERSRLPVNQYSGYVDILINPNGTVVPTTTTFYSTPASANLNSMFYHFWLAERQDVAAPNAASATAPPPYLPIGLPPGTAAAQLAPYQILKGDYRLVTLFTRSGQIATDEDMPFDNPVADAAAQPAIPYNTNYPFLGTQLGITGGP